MRPTIRESDTESVFQSTPDQSGDEDITRVPETIVVEDVLEDVEVTRATQAAFLSLDSVDLTVMFKTRANVMRSPPKFLRGAYKSAMRVALHEWEAGEVVQSEARKSRAWKLFVLLPRMLLFKPPRGGLVAKSKMVERFKFFSDGRWEDLLLLSRDSAMAAVQALGQRRRRAPPDPVEHRAERAHNLIQMGELSAARQALDGDPVAPGNDATLRALRDPQRRPQAPRGPLAPELIGFQAAALVELEQDRLLKNLRSARRGAAGGPSGMTADHVRPLLDSERDAESFCRMCEEFARAQVSDEVVQALRMGRMTALQKSSGGIRGIVGDFIGRLVARTFLCSATEPSH